MAWSKQHIEQLAASGKIRGYVDNGPVKTTKSKKNDNNRSKICTPKKSKALIWLEWNLMYWSNENSLTMEKELKFDDIRKWRFDFAWPAIKLALEFEGGIFQDKSGHKTAKHYTKDTEKYNRAAALGWRVIRVTALNYKSSLKQLNEFL